MWRHRALAALHLTLGMACYGLFAAAVAHAWLMSPRRAAHPPGRRYASGMPLLTLERLTFRFVNAGLCAADGHPAGGHGCSASACTAAPGCWDPQGVFSLLSWVTFAVLLVGRARFGWRGRSAVRVLYAGAALLLLAYVGSRFVLEVVLGRSA